MNDGNHKYLYIIFFYFLLHILTEFSDQRPIQTKAIAFITPIEQLDIA